MVPGIRTQLANFGDTLAAARHTMDLDASGLAPGVYVVRAEGETFSATQRITVVR